MSVEDPVTKILKDGKEKLGTSVQKALLTQLSSKSHEINIISQLIIHLAGLDRNQSELELETAPSSRLALLLKLSVTHSDGFQLHEADRKYMEGWQHCLMAIQSKYQLFQICLKMPSFDQIGVKLPKSQPNKLFKTA